PSGAGCLMPIDPRTGKPGDPLPVRDPYNMYFTPDGRYAVVVAEADRSLALYDPPTGRRVGARPGGGPGPPARRPPAGAGGGGGPAAAIAAPPPPSNPWAPVRRDRMSCPSNPPAVRVPRPP
ncbi:YncE family protein, partial [Nocardia wallacei]|uniref:YncE family protein n=1 Tax=Nocardia wallacei TaxID=480035 RepID=UPI003CC7FFCA